MKLLRARTLPAKTYGELYRLALMTRMYRVRYTSEVVISDLRRIVSESPIKDKFAGWTDKRLGRWFYDFFLRSGPRCEAAPGERRDEIYEATQKELAWEELRRRQRTTLQIEQMRRDRILASLGIPPIAKPEATESKESSKAAELGK